MTLPLLVSVPHGGTGVPPEVADACRLTEDEVRADGDVGAAEIYGLLEEHVAAFVTTHVARAIVDLNRAEDDFGKDGVVKTHTCWDVPVYERPPSAELVEALLERYHRPYHARLTALAAAGIRLGVDCHTMAAVAPPVAPDPGRERPPACLSDADGTCPAEWTRAMVDCVRAEFGAGVRVNDPFRGGYIIRRHASELPWIQLELSRAEDLTPREKGARVLSALRAWCDRAL